jgi:phosphatidylglycerol:prolipoprotein diacylglycerol transferase
MRYSYAAIMVFAVAVAWLISRRTQQRLPLDTAQKVGLAVGAFCGAMLGAKLPFVMAEWEALSHGVVPLGDGKTILTGLVGGYLGVVLAKWALDIHVRTGDSFAVPVAVAIGIGRLGCFVAGCCYGTPTNLPWGVPFVTAGDSVATPRHPTQLYEAAFHLTMAGILTWLGRKHLFVGQRFKFYIVAYALYRFATEWIRPEPKLAWGLTVYQWLALALAGVFAGLILWESHSGESE